MVYQRVVITGIGVISPIATGKTEFWTALLAGTSGVRPIQSFDSSAYAAHIGGEVLDFDPAQHVKKLPPEYLHEPRMALAAGSDGLDIVHRILAEAPKHLTAKGALLCEVGRGKANLETAYPRTPFLWLDTEQSQSEVFWLGRSDLP